MDKELLDTLVKLASAGTSGVCILAIFWSGYLLLCTPPKADIERHRSLRHFMTVALAVAVVSAFAASISSYFNYRQIVGLKAQGASLALANKNLEGEVNLSRVRLREADAQMASVVRQREQLEAVTKQFAEKVEVAKTSDPALANEFKTTLDALRRVERPG